MIKIPTILLPKKEIDLNKWAVIAVDQYTSQSDYWHDVEDFVGDDPSTLHVVLPEVYLEGDDVDKRIKSIHRKMEDYLADILVPYEGFVYVEREFQGVVRRGVVVALDLEEYDYNAGSVSAIRATEGTILERVPPRVNVRRGASLEFPHIMVLIDDPEDRVLGSLKREELTKLYDFELMKGGGKVQGYFVDEAQKLIDRFGGLVKQRLLFAMGDGNHSLAAAKAYWEEIKPNVAADHPARYALVEVVNLHDPSIVFEPIHRVLFSAEGNVIDDMLAFYGATAIYHPCSKEEMFQQVDDGSHVIGIISGGWYGVVKIEKPFFNLPVGSLQHFLDQRKEKIDYIHGRDALCSLCDKSNNMGFYLPAMPKDQLFKTIVLDGVLPRKTFSIGEADSKRFYLEGRQIN